MRAATPLFFQAEGLSHLRLSRAQSFVCLAEKVCLRDYRDVKPSSTLTTFMTKSIFFSLFSAAKECWAQIRFSFIKRPLRVLDQLFTNGQRCSIYNRCVHSQSLKLRIVRLSKPNICYKCDRIGLRNYWFDSVIQSDMTKGYVGRRSSHPKICFVQMH